MLPYPHPLMLISALSAMLLGAALIAIERHRIRTKIRSWEKTSATIVANEIPGISGLFSKTTRYTIYFEYTFQGRSYSGSGEATHRFFGFPKSDQRFMPGQTVIILVNPKNPKNHYSTDLTKASIYELIGVWTVLAALFFAYQSQKFHIPWLE